MAFLKLYAPDFCFLTSADLLKMRRVLNPRMCKLSFRVVLSGLVSAGYFETRGLNPHFKTNDRRLNPLVYRRIK